MKTNNQKDSFGEVKQPNIKKAKETLTDLVTNNFHREVIDERIVEPVKQHNITQLKCLGDFQLLQEGVKVHSIINGNISHYLFIKENFKCKGQFIMLESGNYCSAVVVKPNFEHKRHFWFIDYNSKQVGEEMIRQSQCLIESYKQIYFHE